MKNYLNKLKAVIPSMLLLLVGMGLSPSLRADILTIGTGTSGTSSIFPRNYTDGVTEWLITAEEINAAGGGIGAINSIALQCGEVSNFNVASASFQIRMINTSLMTLPTNTIHSSTDFAWTTVYSRSTWNFSTAYGEQYGMLGMYANGDWMKFPLDAPFTYQGGNILIKLCHTRTSYDIDGDPQKYIRYSSTTNANTHQSDYAGTIICSNGYTSSSFDHFKPNTQLDMNVMPTIKGIFPRDTIFGANDITGDIVAPYMLISRKAEDPIIDASYEVRTANNTIAFQATTTAYPYNTWIPVPSTMVSDNSFSPAIPFNLFFNRATGGRADNSASDGIARMNFRSSAVQGGMYYTTAKIRYLYGGVMRENTVTGSFEVAYDNDIAISGVSRPESYSKVGTTYPLSSVNMSIAMTAKNVGKNPFINFDLSFVVTRPNGEVCWEADKPTRLTSPISKNGVYTYEFFEFNPRHPSIVPELTPGIYTLTVRAKLVDVKEPYEGDNVYTVDFMLDHPYDGSVSAILDPDMRDTMIITTKPDNTLDTTIEKCSYHYEKQPFYPAVQVFNNAAFNVSNVPVNVVITKQGDPTELYNETQEVLSLPGRILSNITKVGYTFTTPFFPPEAGNYVITVTIDTDNDANTTDNTLTTIFEVKPSLSGNIYVGKDTIGRDPLEVRYSTIEDVFADIYKKGIAGTVNIILIDSIYEIGNNNTDYALEIASAIAGFDDTKQINIIPDAALAKSKGKIKINMRSKNGVGIHFTSATASRYPYAPVNVLIASTSQAIGDRVKDFYQFNANINIDGGINKAIQFEMSNVTNGNNRIPILIEQGVSDVTIANCIIKGSLGVNSSIPRQTLDVKENMPVYAPINNINAGVVLHNTPPSSLYNPLLAGVDTLPIKDIHILNNTISGFGYGIISTGIAPLYNTYLGYWVNYYNSNNKFNGNTITEPSIAGIFLGYENTSEIKYNIISRVNNSSLNFGGDNAGIILGGYSTDAIGADLGFTGYNNINITIDGNEVGRVNAHNNAYGIKVEQELNNFEYAHVSGDKHFPDGNDSIKIFNNAIWGLNSTGGRYGIRLFGARAFNTTDKFDAFTKVKDKNLTISHAKIINNTVVIDENGVIDNDNVYIAGITAQDVNNITIYNNAIAILDSTNTADVVAPLVLQSVRPSITSKIDIDNNIYYGPALVAVRFIEKSTRGNFFSNVGSRLQFIGLDQWSYVGGMDQSSFIHDFTKNLYITDGAIQRLRIVTPAPIGSYLDNRGKRFAYVTSDIDGNGRGLSDQQFDIGAWEFNGTMFANDLSVNSFVTPIAIREADHPIFKDAEYIMTPNKTEVKVNVRNNGSQMVMNRPVTLKVEMMDDKNAPIRVVANYTKNATVASGETYTVNFDIDVSKNEFPKSYEELKMTAPSRFQAMARNVSPVYSFTVTIPPDEDNTNNFNLTSKYVRYYIKTSPRSILVNGKNLDVVPFKYTGDYQRYISDNLQNFDAESQDKITSYLNYRALHDGLNSIGFFNDTVGFDVFDREAWQPSAVNYTTYRYMFWADGNNDILTNEQEADINKFLSNAIYYGKKHLIFSSEELSRNSAAKYADNLYENDYIQNIFGVTPKGNGIYNSTYEANGGLLLTGNALVPDAEIVLTNTTIVPDFDVAMRPAIFHNYGNTARQNYQALFYTKSVQINKSEKTFGIASAAIADNTVYLGADWRNYKDPSIVLAAILNFIGGFTLDPEEPTLATELVAFNAFIVNSKVMLNWETASDDHISNYIIERSNNNIFTPINNVNPHANGSIVNYYNSIDDNVVAGNSYDYRLKLVDFNGNFKYSEVRNVVLDASTNTLSLERPTPNPASDILNIKFNLSNEMNIRLSIFDITGKEIAVVANGAYQASAHSITFDVSNLPSGSYNLMLSAGGTTTYKTFIIK